MILLSWNGFVVRLCDSCDTVSQLPVFTDCFHSPAVIHTDIHFSLSRLIRKSSSSQKISSINPTRLLPLTTCCAVTSPYFFLFFKIILQFVIICLAIRKNIFINLFSFFFPWKTQTNGNKDFPFPGSPSQIPLSIRVGPGQSQWLGIQSRSHTGGSTWAMCCFLGVH